MQVWQGTSLIPISNPVKWHYGSLMSPFQMLFALQTLGQMGTSHSNLSMDLHFSIFEFRVFDYDNRDTPVGNPWPIEEYTHPSLGVTFSGDQTRAIATP